jgi:hypothetical protein
MPSNSVLIEITTGTTLKPIDSILTGLFATPQVNFGPLTVTSFTKTPDTVGTSTTFDLKFTTGTNGALPSG